MKMQRLMLLGIGLVAVACEHDKGPFLAPDDPKAYVRFVSAVTDTNAVDFKFIDRIGDGYYQHAPFRSISAYQQAFVGQRHVAVFAVDPDEGATHQPRIEIVTQKLKDTTITLEQGKYYTFLMTGTARNNQTYINVIEDARAVTPSNTQIAVHAINASVSGNVDVYSLPDTSAAVSGTAAFAALVGGKGQAYSLQSTGKFAYFATTAGTTTTLAKALAPAGAAPASVSQSALGGYTIGGSYLTAFYFPGAVAGSMASPTTPGVVWIQDNAPIPQ